MTPNDIRAIDVHAHFGTYRSKRSPQLVNEFVSGDADTVVARARQVNIETTIVSPLSALLPRGNADPVAGNVEAAQVVAATDGLLQWVVAHPSQTQTFRQVDEMLEQPQCVGIKVHPEEHVYSIREHGESLFKLAARHDAIVLAHSGDPNSWPVDFVDFANAYPNVTLILAHLGNGGGASGDPTLQVRAIQACKHGNVFVDTSSARSIAPRLIEWAVSEIGSDRILFGTDAPLYSTAMQRARIDYADISDEDKCNILRKNATRLLASSRNEKTC
ncbi:MAG: amidohydrolase family protein [Planctomycetes bacterium]|nr:amidohydrolase family protein [Planctomycetota bacterium]